MKDIRLFKKGIGTFKAPVAGVKEQFSQRLFLADDARQLDAQRTDLISEKFDLQFTKQGGILMLRQTTEAEKARVIAIDNDLDDITAKVFCARVPDWPFTDSEANNAPVPCTLENVKAFFPGTDGAEFLNNILLWAQFERYPKPETASS